MLKDIILSFKNQDNLEDEIINNICVKKSKILLNELENEPKKYWKEFFNIKNLKDFSSPQIFHFFIFYFVYNLTLETT